MNERLYNLMDWAEIEAVTYAETDNQTTKYKKNTERLQAFDLGLF